MGSFELEGEHCACFEGEWQRRPPHERRHVPSDRWDDVFVETCSLCGACWLVCLFEDHHSNSSWYRGLLDAAVAAEIDGSRAEALFAAMPWYWEGGSYLGTICRTRGAIIRR